MKTDIPIVRVYGTIDNREIEFSMGKNDEWQCNVPPDLSDGQYATEVIAMNSLGEYAYWTGILYMFGGKGYLSLSKCRYEMELLPQNTGILMLEQQHFLKEVLSDD